MSPRVRLHLLSFVLMATVGVAAPAAQSLFLGAFDAAMLPWAWVAVTLAAAPTVLALRRLGRRRGVGACLAAAAAASLALLVALLAGDAAGWRPARFALYVWRDLGIIVTLELFWTLVGLSELAARASRAYGWLCASGTVGGVAASLLTAATPAALGERGALWAAVPLLAATAWLAAGAPGAVAPAGPATPAPAAQMRAMTPAIWRILLLVALSHLALTVLDYQFSAAVQAAFPDAGPRLRAVSWVQAAIKALSFLFQISWHGWVAALGLAGALWATPLGILAALGAHALGGGFVALAVAKVLGKSTDYALFRAGKEMLYLPLSRRERTDGKALVDILGSRAAKGLASLGLFALVAAGGRLWVGPVGLAAAAAWVVASWPLTARWPPR